MLLSDLTWLEAERHLTADAVVLLPLGAAAKEHGPHLRLDNDARLAEALRDRLLSREPLPLIAAPTLTYHHYPAFVEYPGSTTLRETTARDLVVDVCASLAAFGPRRFYVLNTGVSTMRPLEAAAAALRARGLLMAFTDLRAALEPVERSLLAQEAGTHADEGETSMMLALSPHRVDMGKAVRDIHERRSFRLTRDGNAEALYSPTGVYGDATLATREKGEALVAAVLAAALHDIAALRLAAPPNGPPSAPPVG
ncbi:MAG: creatininase family protein [Myxococcales bacterium]|nr:creatininase family protein [Myxococcales bacterium]